MRVLIVKLSSLGDVVHALPVLSDVHRAFDSVTIDWVVEPTFAHVLTRVDGVGEVIEMPLRRWRKSWWTAGVRAEFRLFRQRLRRHAYDCVIDLQGLTKSAVVARLARGPSVGLANRTEGSSHEAPARWLVDRAITVPSRVHAIDRCRILAAAALGYAVGGPARFGLSSAQPVSAAPSDPPLMVFVHGTSRDDKLWPETHWIALGNRLVDAGWRIALPHAGTAERERAQRLASAIGPACVVWPSLGLDQLVDRMAQARGVIGVDSGLSHIAVALDLPHVQIYNFATAWRTGPQPGHGNLHQVSIEAPAGQLTPTLEAVWTTWQAVQPLQR